MAHLQVFFWQFSFSSYIFFKCPVIFVLWIIDVKGKKRDHSKLYFHLEKGMPFCQASCVRNRVLFIIIWIWALLLIWLEPFTTTFTSNFSTGWGSPFRFESEKTPKIFLCFIDHLSTSFQDCGSPHSAFESGCQSLGLVRNYLALWTHCGCLPLRRSPLYYSLPRLRVGRNWSRVVSIGLKWLRKIFILDPLLCTQILSSSVHFYLRGLSLTISSSSQREPRFQIVQLGSFAMPLVHSHPAHLCLSWVIPSALILLSSFALILGNRERVERGYRLSLLMRILGIFKHHAWPLKGLISSSPHPWHFFFLSLLHHRWRRLRLLLRLFLLIED